MYESTISRNLETNTEISLDIGLLDSCYDAFLLPCVLDDVIYDRSNRDITAHILGQKCSALLVIACSDVVCESISILGSCYDFLICHSLFLLNDRVYCVDVDLAFSDHLSCLLGFGCHLLEFVLSLFESIEFGLEFRHSCLVRTLDFLLNLGSTNFDFLDCHVFDFSHLSFPPRFLKSVP